MAKTKPEDERRQNNKTASHLESAFLRTSGCIASLEIVRGILDVYVPCGIGIRVPDVDEAVRAVTRLQCELSTAYAKARLKNMPR